MDELLWKDVALKKRLRCFHCKKDDIDVRMCDSEKLGRVRHGYHQGGVMRGEIQERYRDVEGGR